MFTKHSVLTCLIFWVVSLVSSGVCCWSMRISIKWVNETCICLHCNREKWASLPTVDVKCVGDFNEVMQLCHSFLGLYFQWWKGIESEPRVEIIIQKIVLVSLQIPSSLPEVLVRRWVSDLPLSAQRSWSFRCPSCRSWYSLRGMLWSWICWLDDWYAMGHAMIIKPSTFLQLLTNRTSKNQFPSSWLQFWSDLWISSGCCIFSHYDS